MPLLHCPCNNQVIVFGLLRNRPRQAHHEGIGLVDGHDFLTKARLRKSTLIVLVVTIVAFVAALAIRESDNGSSPLLTAIYQGLGAIAGLGTAFVVVFVPLYSWQERRKNRSGDNRSQ